MSFGIVIMKYAWIVGALPLLIGLFKFKYLNYALKIIILHLFLGSLVEVASRIMMELEGNNLPLMHLYTVEEFLLIGLFYRYNLKGFVPTKWMNWIIIIFISYSVVNSLFIRSIYEYNNLARGVESLVIIIFSVLYFMKVFNNLDISNLRREPMIWLNTALLFYFSSSLFLFIFSNITLKVSNELSMSVWTFHAVFTWLMYILIARGLWLAPKKLR